MDRPGTQRLDEADSRSPARSHLLKQDLETITEARLEWRTRGRSTVHPEFRDIGHGNLAKPQAWKFHLSMECEQMQSRRISLTSSGAKVAMDGRSGEPPEQLETKEISMKSEGIDIARYMPLAEPAEHGVFSPQDISLAQIEKFLSILTSFERVLFENRQNIEAIKARREKLARECCELSISFQSASSDLAKQFEDVIKDLRTDLTPVGGPKPTR